jgi:hypothetical protein
MRLGRHQQPQSLQASVKKLGLRKELKSAEIVLDDDA